MNWEQIAAIAQVFTAVAIIPFLVYLAIQIRDQSKERRRAAAS